MKPERNVLTPSSNIISSSSFNPVYLVKVANFYFSTCNFNSSLFDQSTCIVCNRASSRKRVGMGRVHTRREGVGESFFQHSTRPFFSSKNGNFAYRYRSGIKLPGPILERKTILRHILGQSPLTKKKRQQKPFENNNDKQVHNQELKKYVYVHYKNKKTNPHPIRLIGKFHLLFTRIAQENVLIATAINTSCTF